MKKIILITTITIFLSSCGIIQPINNSVQKLSKITIGDDRNTVIAKIGEPDNIRGSRILENGSIQQVDEYALYKKGAATRAAIFCPLTLGLACLMTRPGSEQTFWMHYIDGRLIKWGKVGDWQ
jgi:hypothetical protein